MFLRREAAYAIVVSLLFHGIALGVVAIGGYEETELRAVKPLRLTMSRIDEQSETVELPKASPPPPPPVPTPRKVPAPKKPAPKQKVKKPLPPKRVAKKREAVAPQVTERVEKRMPVVDGTAEVAKADYEALVAARIAANKRYPRIARRRGQEGEGLVRLSILSSGTLGKVEIIHASGSAVLDKEMKAMVERAAPFPPFPKNLRRRAISFVAPIRFQLR